MLLLLVTVISITVDAHVNHECIQGIRHTALLFLLGKYASVFFVCLFVSL